MLRCELGVGAETHPAGCARGSPGLRARGCPQCGRLRACRSPYDTPDGGADGDDAPDPDRALQAAARSHREGLARRRSKLESSINGSTPTARATMCKFGRTEKRRRAAL